jgi:transposase-like protein/IS1 family transposase
MNTHLFTKLLDQVSQLTDQQTTLLGNALTEHDPVAQIIKEIEQRLVDNPECPHCHSALINRHGKTAGMQRYRCKNCLKTFHSTTKTPLAWLHYKERWFDYYKCMLESKVLRESAAICHINLKTSFRWRHKFLQLPAMLKAHKLEGIIEADETFFRYSEKGNKTLTRPPRKRGSRATKRGRSSDDWVPVVTVRDRGKHTFEAILPHVTAQNLSDELRGKLEKDSVLCTDGFKPYIKFSKDNDLIHKRLNVAGGIRTIDTVFHIQNVNAYHSRLKNWIARFHGVATKYLENYLGWHRFMDNPNNCNENNMFKIQQQLTGT